MVKNYLKTSFRNVSRNKFYTLLNMAGLAIGLTTTIFILLYIQDELSYDRYNKKSERIYRLASDFSIGNKQDKFAITSLPLAPALKLEYPEIQDYVRFCSADRPLIRNGEKEYYEDNIFYTDPSIFNVFTLKMLAGNPKDALTEPFSVVLTQKLARKYFGKANPYGKMIEVMGDRKYKVTGVVENLPSNTHLKYDALFSIKSLEVLYGKEFMAVSNLIAYWNVNAYSYVLLKDKSDISRIHQKFPAFYDKYMGALGKKVNAKFTLITTPLPKIHFSSGLEGDLPTGDIQYIYIFGLVALFILLIASINYMNMATARSAQRAKEVGMRKVLGADRGRIRRQFLSESLLLSVLSLIIALGLIGILLPTFNNLSDKHLTFGVFSNPMIFLEILIVTLLVGLISGSYPAFYLSAYEPAMVLKGRIKTGREGPMMRKILVVFQFTVSIIMIIATIVVSRQLSYMKNKDLGFDKSNVVFTSLQDSTLRKSAPAFKQELLKNPEVVGVACSNGLVVNNYNKNVVLVEINNKMEQIAVNNFSVDADYVDVMRIKVIKGRNFEKGMATDSTQAVLVNEAAVKKYGWGENAVGKKIQYDFNRELVTQKSAKVIGVVKDFNYQSLHNPVEPMVLFFANRPTYFLTIRMKPGTEKNVLEFLKNKWLGFDTKRPFDYSFLDKELEKSYTAETKIGKIFTWFSFLSIFIALLGLLGLSSFVANQRAKEIGIRKILGATVPNITRMLSREFITLIIIAFVIAAPVSYYALGKWLTTFTYHVEVNGLVFLLAAFLSLVVGLLAIGYHIFKAATDNPIKAIKYE